METGAVLLILTVIIFTGLFISRPFFEPKARAGKTGKQDHLRSSLLAEQERLITVLQELDFDFALGKVPEEEYPAQRAALMHKGAEILQQLDALQPAAIPESVESRLESAIAARRAIRPTVAVGAGGVVDDDLERIISQRRQAQKENSNGFCPKCGKPVLKSDRFCPRCGATLEQHA